MTASLSLIGRYDPALAEAFEQGGDDELAIIARLSGDVRLGEGVRIVSRFGDIVTLRVQPGQVAALARDESLLHMEAPRKLRRSIISEASGLQDVPWTGPELDGKLDADSSAAATVPYSRRPEGVTATGRGCVIGVLDWGCDFAFPAFRHPDGSSRILALWDQRPDEVQTRKNRWGYGRIYHTEEINKALASEDPYKALGYDPADADDEKGAHGTHVLDIAAGNGRGGGMSGVAPDADIVFVHLSRTTRVLGKGNLGDSATVLEALDFVFSVAGERPCVINMSVGAHGGPHDGTTGGEQGIDRVVSLSPGRAVVNSAGNYFSGAIHAQGRMSRQEEQVLRFKVPVDDPTASELEVWYPGGDKATATVIGPDGNVLATVETGQHAPLLFEVNDLGHIYHNSRHPTNGDNHIDLFLEPHAPGGIWQLRLRGDDIVDGRYHAWIERDTGLRPRFLSASAVSSSTTGTLCNGRVSITVGAYDPHDDRKKLGRFSSSGPTRDGRIKPEIVAPGVRIQAARSRPSGQAPSARYIRKSGTSMAAPHVTGTIALMFEAAEAPLEISETRAILFASTQRGTDRFRGQAKSDLHRLGYGYLDIAAAERAAREWRASNMSAIKNTDETLHESMDEAAALFAEEDALTVTYGEVQHFAAPLSLRDNLQQAFLDPTGSLDSAGFHRRALASMGVGPQDGLWAVARPFVRPAEPIRAGDILIRSMPYEGLLYSAVILSDRPEKALELSVRGVVLENLRPGSYVEVLEVPLRGGRVRTMGRRLTDSYGRMLRGQSVYRPDATGDGVEAGVWPDSISLAAPGLTPSRQWSEAISVDDVAEEMTGLRCRFVQAYTASRGSDSRSFANGVVKSIGAWNGTAAEVAINGFLVPKLVIEPHTDPVTGVRRYDLTLQAQRAAVLRNDRQLANWLAREAAYQRNRSLWESEKARLEQLLERRRRTYSQMWVRQMMYNRFDGDILHWTQHYNRALRPNTTLNPNIPKSIFYQESRMGTSGTHLMPPPSDWSSSSAHPIRSRYNIGQAIDSFGPQQWLMMQEMAPAIFRHHGLDALESSARWQGMTNNEYVHHSTFMRALRQFFEYRSGGNNLMGTAGKDLHEDYGFWIRTAIRWLFHKYMGLRPPSWAEAVRAYNGSGAVARHYRDAVMARVTDSAPFAAEQDPEEARWNSLSVAGRDIELSECDALSSLFEPGYCASPEEMGKEAPHLDTSAELSWEDLNWVRDSRGERQVFYLVTGAPARAAAAGDEGKAVFHLRVRNTNRVFNHLDVATRTRLIDFGPRRTSQRIVMSWTRPQSGPDLEDESSRVIVLHLNSETLSSAYNPDSPLTRLEVEYHWRKAGESRQRHYNRIGLDFMLVTPIEYLFSRSRRMHSRDHELNDLAQHRDDFWIPVTGVDFTPEIQSPVTVQLDVSTSLTQQISAGGGVSARTSRSRTQTTTTSNTFSLQLSGEVSRGGNASASIEIFELGLERMFQLGASLGYSRTTTETSSTTVAREFSRSLTWSRSYSTSQAMLTRTTLQVSPPILRGPSGTGSTGSRATARGGSMGVYLYPTVAFFEVPFVRFTPANALGQGTRRESGTVAVPHITGWRLTVHAGS